MGKLNTKSSKTLQTSESVVTSLSVSTKTYEGGEGYLRDAKSELFLLAVSNFVSESTFYEEASARDSRYVQLLDTIVRTDPFWVHSLLVWLRREANMRSASLVGAAEVVRIWTSLSAEEKESAHRGQEFRPRALVNDVLVRADEPAEILSYWLSNYGRRIPQPLKRGVADAAIRLYNERNFLKWDSSRSAVRMSDVISLTHPHPDMLWQDKLFSYILNNRYGNSEALTALLKEDTLPMIKARAQKHDREEYLANPQLLEQVGATWEYLSTWGPMDAAAWEAVIPQMGYFALIRNLRNFEQAGISKETRQLVINRLSDPQEVKKSRLLPLRFATAYSNVESDYYKPALQDALDLSLDNVPVISTGSAAILIDTSYSMTDYVGGAHSSVHLWEQAALFGIAVARKFGNARIFSYASSGKVKEFTFTKGANVLKELERFRKDYFFGGGTDTPGAVDFAKRNMPKLDHLVILTDEQYSGIYAWMRNSGQTMDNAIGTTESFIFNLAGYQQSSVGNKPNIHTVGGLSDKAFDMLTMTINHQGDHWPWDKE